MKEKYKLAGSSASINPRLFAVNFQRFAGGGATADMRVSVRGAGGKTAGRDGAEAEMEGGNGRPTQTQQHRLPLPEALVTTRTSGSPPSLPGSLEHRLGGRIGTGRRRDITRLPGWGAGAAGLPLLSKIRSQLEPLRRLPSYLHVRLERDHVSFPPPPYAPCSRLSHTP